ARATTSASANMPHSKARCVTPSMKRVIKCTASGSRKIPIRFDGRKFSLHQPDRTIIAQDPGLQIVDRLDCRQRIACRGLREQPGDHAGTLDLVERDGYSVADRLVEVRSCQDEAPGADGIERIVLAGIEASAHGEPVEEWILVADARDLLRA